MPLNIGIMMTRNEEDIIQEVMDAHQKHFEYIFVLDGSTDRTRDILRSYKNVVHLVCDHEVIPHGKVSDGVRQFLIEEAQKRFGYSGYFTLLHGDEIFHDDPNQIVEKAQEENIELVRWQMCTFFPHVSERGTVYHEQGVFMSARLQWCTPHWIEVRQFKNMRGVNYPLEQHHSLVPAGIHPLKTNMELPLFKHYSFRTPEQMRSRVRDRAATGFVTQYAWMLYTQDLYFETFPGCPEAYRFTEYAETHALGDKPLRNAYEVCHALVMKIHTHLKQYPPSKHREIIPSLCTQLIAHAPLRELIQDALFRMV